MRILIFTDSFYPELGGIQDSLVATTRALGERGHEILLCAPSHGRHDHGIVNLPPGEIELGGNVTVRRLLSMPIPSSTRQSRLLLPTGQRWRRLANFRPDVVHTHTFLGAGWEAVNTARQLRVPLVGTNHWAIGEFGSYVPLPAALFARASVGAVTTFYNRCDLVTGPSRSVLDEMRDAGLRRPHFVVSNPIDTACFSPASPPERLRLKRALGFSKATIVYAGRLAVEKNIDVLIRALVRLRDAIPEVMLVLAGHGTAQDRLQALAEELGVAAQVRFLGTLSAAALADAYRAADVFAIASTSETQSMALLQAMSAGLPAVGARWRALEEYLPDDAGFLVGPGEPEDFASRIGVLLRQPSMRARMGERAACFAAHFALAEVVGRWEAIYASLAAAQPPSLQSAA